MSGACALALTAPAGAHAAKVALDGNANSLDAGLEAVVAFLGVAEEDPAVVLNATRVEPEVALLSGPDGFGLE